MKGSWGVQKKRRRYIEVWLFFMLLFSVNFFDLLPVTALIGPNGAFTFTMLTLFFCFTFNRTAWIRDHSDWLHPFWWFYVGIVLSVFPAFVYYGQSLVQSFFTYRRFFQFLAFPIFIAIRPTEREFRSALQTFSVVYLLTCLFVTFLAPNWIELGDNEQLVERGDYFHNIEGIRIVSLAFIFSFHRMMKEFNYQNFLWTLFIFSVLFLIQNRTSLLAVMLMVVYSVLSMKASVRKIMLVTVIGLVVLLMFVYTSGQWGHLYQQTIEEIFNPDYNRNKAYLYMFASREWPRYLLGDGFISANVSGIIRTLQESGIFFSDVGFVGMWYQFGVIPALTVLVMCIKAFAKPKSFLVKACSIYILIGIPTMSYFAIGESLLWLSVFLYVFYSDQLPSFFQSVRRKVVGLNEVRYRSLSR